MSPGPSEVSGIKVLLGRGNKMLAPRPLQVGEIVSSSLWLPGCMGHASALFLSFLDPSEPC